jgi:hypothetical protein
MRRKALIALASVLVLGVVWMWPAFSEPAAHQPCGIGAEDGGIWGYDVVGRTWACADWNVRFGQYGVPGL